jgi:tetratricopeptide (TPR) repeat protein
MKKRLVAAVLVLCLGIFCGCSANNSTADATTTEAATSTTTATDDELDVSKDAAKVSELGIPTVESVESLKSAAVKLWNAKDYEKAAEAYATYATNANWLANLISVGLDPYYDATSSEQTSLYKSDKDFFNNLVAGEKKANYYKSERNVAMARRALCYYYLGDYTTAVPLLTKALDLIEIDDVDTWKLCMEALYDIVGYTK